MKGEKWKGKFGKGNRRVTSAPVGGHHSLRSMAKRKKSEATASPSKGGGPARPRRLSAALRRDWLGPAVRCKQALLTAAGVELPSAEPGSDPVGSARRHAEAVAPFDMQVLDAIRFGLSLKTLEQYHRSLRLVSDLALRNLAMVGLKTGETVEMDLSDRMREFLTRWNEPAEPGPVLPPAGTIDARGAPISETEPDRP